MELSVESVVAIIGLFVAFPPALLILWHCFKRRGTQRQNFPRFIQKSDVPGLMPVEHVFLTFESRPQQSSQLVHLLSISVSYAACQKLVYEV
ncbi:hypothetical protein F5Y01DRAFT_280506 [Xylaria sp. FL0043]|nr:hypothetical protein F5Y01DRAFT_280506 [Xylaria sp. FL0043]